MAQKTSNNPDDPTDAARRRVDVAEAMARLPGAGGERFAEVFKRGSLLVEIYAPRGTDPQRLHTRDEVYIVVAGRGESTAASADRSRPATSSSCPRASSTASRTSPKTSSCGSSSTAPKAARDEGGRRKAEG